MPLIECVPNVSEGRRSEIIATLATAFSTTGVHMLDQSSDPSHNRTVYTVVGEAGPLQTAVLALFASAIALIDLRTHRGVHPRIGVIDVVPFIPLAGASMTACVDLAQSTAEQVFERFGIPVYLYEEAARREHRKSLADIRRGGLDALATRMREDDWRPDFGGTHPHPTAGVSAIGARPILIAYNVNLATNRLEVARRIAKTIRSSGGGLSYVRAMGVPLEHRGIVQVSMNLTNYQHTSMTTAFDAVTREAAADGIGVIESEIVGLVPADALPEAPITRLKLSPADADRVLERRLAR